MNEIINWLEQEIVNEFPNSSNVECWAGDRHLKHYEKSKLAGISNAIEWEFTPDFVAVFEFKGLKKIVFMNYTPRTLGLTELGELHVFAKIADPILAIQATGNGLSKDLYSLLLDKGIQDRLLGYGFSRRILVGQWDTSTASIPHESYFPPKDF